MGKIIAVISGKGGTGKTTAVGAIGSCLGALGKSTLCVDCDAALQNLDIVLGTVNYVIFTCVAILFDFDPSAYGQEAASFSKYYLAGASAFWAVLSLLVGWVINLIATRKVRKNLK